MGTFLQYGDGGHFVGTLLPLPPRIPILLSFSIYLIGDILERRNLGIRLGDAVAKSCNCRQHLPCNATFFLGDRIYTGSSSLCPIERFTALFLFP